MLNKRESEVMSAIYSLCYEKGICLISPDELISMLPVRKKYNEEQLEKILSVLALDNYFELLSSERKGEKTYVISLRANGYAFKRFSVQQKRDFAVKLGWIKESGALGTVTPFTVGKGVHTEMYKSGKSS